jgi:hypothetical protein
MRYIPTGVRRPLRDELKMKTRVIAVCVLASLMSGCSRNSSPSQTAAVPAQSSNASSAAAAASIPVAALSDAQLLRQFGEDHYGNWRADRKGWQPDEGGDIYSRCGSLRVNTADGPRYLLAMCGETEAAERNGIPGADSEGDQGGIDFYVLKLSQDGRHLEPVIQQKDISSGHNGEPGMVRIQKFGPHLFGFAIDEDDSQEGYSQSIRSVYLPLGGKFVEAAARINLELNNSGAVDCSKPGEACISRKFQIAPEVTSTGDVYSLKVTEDGTQGHRTYVVPFDPIHGNYVVPAALSEGF